MPKDVPRKYLYTKAENYSLDTDSSIEVLDFRKPHPDKFTSLDDLLNDSVFSDDSASSDDSTCVDDSDPMDDD